MRNASQDLLGAQGLAGKCIAVVVTAQGNRLVVLRHGLKPALIPVVSYLGPAAGFLLTGSLVVETIFGLPGIGQYFIQAALNRDYGMVLGTVIFYMVLIVLLNLLVDLIYAWLDPRVRYR